MSAQNPITLIGAGSHAQMVAQLFTLAGYSIASYVDDNPSAALAEKTVRLTEAELEATFKNNPALAMAFLGIQPGQLERRLSLQERYGAAGAKFPAAVHSSAIVSEDAVLKDGVHILPGAIVNSGAIIEKGATINSGAIIEHGAYVGAGCHVAPRATLLGGVQLGRCSFVGAGAVIVQNAAVPPGQFIKALTITK